MDFNKEIFEEWVKRIKFRRESIVKRRKDLVFERKEIERRAQDIRIEESLLLEEEKSLDAERKTLEKRLSGTKMIPYDDVLMLEANMQVLDRKADGLEAKRRELDKKILGLRKQQSSFKHNEYKMKKEEEHFGLLEKRLQSRQDTISKLEKKLADYEGRLLRKKAAKEDGIKDIISDEHRAEVEGLSYDSDSYKALKAQEAEYRGELEKIISESEMVWDQEKSLFEQQKELEAEEEVVVSKELKSKKELNKIIEAERKLEALEVRIEHERESIMQELDLVKAERGALFSRERSIMHGASVIDLSNVPLKPGFIYLVNEENILVEGVIPQKSINILSSSLESGCHGLVISRTNPRQLEELYELKNTVFYWLSDVKDHEGLNTVYGLSDISITISGFTSSADGTCILIDGLEYLVSNDGFKPTLSFIQHLRDLVSEKQSKILIPVNFKSLSEQEAMILSRECNVIN